MAAIVPAARTAATDATWRGLISNGFPGGSRDRGRRRLMSETNPVGRVMKAVARGVGLVEAGGIMEVVMTVWSNVFEIGRLAPGERLLVHGGSSGIGTMAIQLARALGSTAYATAGSTEKCARCVALGAARAINYKDEDFVEIVKRETDG